MKRYIPALTAVSALMTLSHPAFSQSSVTLYGIVDQGINYNSNAGGHPLYNTSSGVMSASRWGLRGIEDLGGGLKALFVLENGFNLGTGAMGQNNFGSRGTAGSTQGLMFGRQAYVGLSSGWGTITLGRQYDSMVDYVGQLEAGDQWCGYICAHPGDLDNFNNLNRVNNAVKFTSITYSGIKFGALYSLGGISGDVTRNQVWSLGVAYTGGPLTLGAAYLNARNPNVGFFGDNGASTAATSVGTFIQSPVYNGFASAHGYQVAGAAGAYTFGAATIGLTYSNIRFTDLGDTATSGPNALGYSGTATFNNVEINGKYWITPALLLGAAFDYTKSGSVARVAAASNPGAKYLQGAVGVDYFLSKRTDVYMIGVYQHATGTDSQGGPAVAAINLLTPSATSTQTAVRLGIRHKF